MRGATSSARSPTSGRGGLAMGVLGGVANGVSNVVSGARGAIGARGPDELVRTFIDAQQDFIRTTSFAGVSGGRAELMMGNVADVSRNVGVDPTELLNALSVAQNRFSDLEFVAENLESFASAARATGAPVEDMVGAIGELQRQLHIGAEDVPEVIGAMVSGMQAGSLEAGDVAANFAGLLNTFASLRGEAGTGVGGAREFLGVAQALGAAGRDPAQTRTLMENMMSAFSRRDVQSGIESSLHDRNVFDENGRLAISFGELSARMAESETFTTPAGLRRITHDREAAAAILALTNLENGGGATVSELTDVNADAGNELIRTTVDSLNDSSSGRARMVDIRGSANFLENGDALVELYASMVGPLNDLSTLYPRAAVGLQSLVTVLESIGTGVIVGSVVSGGTAAASGAVGAGTGAAAAEGAALAGAASVGTGLAMATGIGAAAAITLIPNEAGGDGGMSRTSSADRLIRRELGADSAEYATYLRNSEISDSVAGRGEDYRDAVAERLSRGATVDAATLERIANAMGVAVARAINQAPPAGGRMTGEPGRRS